MRLDAETRRALDAIGPVRCVVAPSKVHHFFAGDYAAAYPTARVFAAPGLSEKRTDLSIHAVLDDEPQPEWRGVIEQHLLPRRAAAQRGGVLPPGQPDADAHRSGLQHGASRRAGGRGLFCRLIGATGRFGPHRMVRLMIRDRAAARASVRRILAWDFDRVTVTHGEVLETGGKARVAEAFAFLG